MERKLDRLKFMGENCADHNRNNAITLNQKRVIYLIKKCFDDEFAGINFGEAWDFIQGYIGRTYINESGKEIRFFVSRKMDESYGWEDFISDNIEIILEHSIDFQEDYFNQRHEAMLRGKSWDIDDRYDDFEDSYEEKRGILYEENKDDEKPD